MAPWLLPPLLRACRASSSRLHMRGVERELFALIRAAPQEPAGFREACGRVADWGRLVDCAIDHGVAGVVHTEAGKAGVAIPADAMGKLEWRLAVQRLYNVWRRPLRFLRRAWCVWRACGRQSIFPASVPGQRPECSAGTSRAPFEPRPAWQA